MMTIQDYTIFCTEAQTKKALELGAPIKIECFSTATEDHWHEIIPTAEQMIGWLEEQGISIVLKSVMDGDGVVYTWIVHSCDYERYWYRRDNKTLSRKEATLSAIDCALEYLTKNKK